MPYGGREENVSGRGQVVILWKAAARLLHGARGASALCDRLRAWYQGYQEAGPALTQGA